MTDTRIDILHDHYRDTCSVLNGYRSARDWYFYIVIVIVAVAWFDVVAPDDFARLAAETVKSRLLLTNPPDLTYLRAVLWFTLFGIVLRYCQVSLSVERDYKYLHRLESILAAEVHPEFGREGVNYKRYGKPFSKWAHAIYASVFPLLLGVIVATWTAVHIWRVSLWSASVAFETLVSAAIITTLALYIRSHRLINTKPQA